MNHGYNPKFPRIPLKLESEDAKTPDLPWTTWKRSRPGTLVDVYASYVPSGYVDNGISRRGDKFPARLTIHLHVISSSTWNTRSAPTREVVWFLRHSTVGRRNQTPRDVRTDRTTIYGSPPLIRRVFGILELDCPLFRPNRISVARFPFRSWAIYGPLGSSRPITNLFLGYVG